MKHIAITLVLLLQACASVQTEFTNQTNERTSSIESKHTCCMIYTSIANINGRDTINWSDKAHIKPGSNKIIVTTSLKAGHKAIQLIEINIKPDTSYIAKVNYSDDTAWLFIYEEQPEVLILKKPMYQYGAREIEAHEITDNLIQKILNKSFNPDVADNAPQG